MKLFLVVDYQKDFVDGSLGFPGAELLDERIAERIAERRAEGWQIAFTLDTHFENYDDTQEGRKLPVPHCIKGTEGHELFGLTAKAKQPEDLTFEKYTFPSLALAEYLKDKDFDTVEICGLVSNICVISNAVMVKAALPEAEIVCDARLTASNDPSLNEQCLNVMQSLQITVTGRENENE